MAQATHRQTTQLGDTTNEAPGVTPQLGHTSGGGDQHCTTARFDYQRVGQLRPVVPPPPPTFRLADANSHPGIQLQLGETLARQFM